MALQEVPPGGPRSSGLSYQEILDQDSRAVPDVLRWESARELPVVRVPIERYVSPEFHRVEVEKIWRKVWQMACREEEIPEVGDRVVYDIADHSIVVVRSAPDQVRAFHNVCLHRGRQIVQTPGGGDRLRCPFHGWAWNLDGTLAQVPCRWDFPHVERDDYRLPEVKTGTWGGFVFVNLDPHAAPLADFLGELPEHFEPWPLENRYTEAHVEKLLPCNWKVAQEAFMEAYHVVATHPQLLPGIGDSNTQYDAWDTFSRALTPQMTPSPHMEYEPSEQDQIDTVVGTSLGEEPTLRVAEGLDARRTFAQAVRLQLQAAVPAIHDVSDAELNDSLYYTVFPNFHPWAAYNKIVYRFRPHGSDAQHCTMEVRYLAPFRGRRPPPAPVHRLGIDDDWTQAPELGFLCRVFNQDTANLGFVQKGLRAAAHHSVTYGLYQETKIRHFHTLLERCLTA
ncbi:MAG: aromatic ring-hydroxylating dioxygenase subunit alpha [Myxococcota bacterium]|nr:aromatic ring-hydroxylating dioxygenase subunit alpha [Myxococcota bacterium]